MVTDDKDNYVDNDDNEETIMTIAVTKRRRRGRWGDNDNAKKRKTIKHRINDSCKEQQQQNSYQSYAADVI